MKIISWNVNGIRAIAKKGFKAFLKAQKPDILCLQEIKISEAARLLTEFDFAGYVEYWNGAERPGYSGTAILVREDSGKREIKGMKKIKSSKISKSAEIIKGVKSGFRIAKFDKEGRVQTLESEKFFLLNVYFPNANQELSRLNYKLEFNDALLKYAKKLEKLKPVIITGDFNVAHEEIDLARPKSNEGSAGFTPAERAWMTKLLKAGFIDTFRQINGQKVQYSWWSFRMRARERNVGWRIDYFCVSAKLVRSLKKAYILDKITGSDHAPIGLELL